MKKKPTDRENLGKKSTRKSDAPRCGLCGKQGKLRRTECCGEWICDDVDSYVLFSYAENSCDRNHSHKTLCAYHHNEGHDGDWRTCVQCRETFDTEDYVWYGTNKFNFVKLENPPTYEPTHCDGCGIVIKRSEGGYSQGPDGIFCEDCTEIRFIERRSQK